MTPDTEATDTNILLFQNKRLQLIPDLTQREKFDQI